MPWKSEMNDFVLLEGLVKGVRGIGRFQNEK